ncbi:MAG: cysteine hydrolase [Anaerolineaceae bacterium]|nr:MAG: cysteine hydrolase [Anaerolineaceae bacterium]
MEISKDNQALLVIDMQNGLLQKNVYNKQELIDNVNSLLDYSHKENMIVILIRHTNTSFSKENSVEWQLSDELVVSDSDILMNKSHSSIFKEKEFISLLKERNISSVVITGLVSNGCIQAACLDAKKLNFSVVLISDGHSTFHKDGEAVVSYWNTFLEKEDIQLISTAEFKS